MIAPGRAVVTCGFVITAACGRLGFDTSAVDPAREECDTTLADPRATRSLREFEEGPNYRSIGVNAGSLFSTGTATIATGTRLVTFQGATVPAAVGIGDRLEIGGEILFVQRVETPTTLTVQTPAAAEHQLVGFDARRAYTELQAWETDRGGDLVAEDRVEVGVAYNDGPFPAGLTVAGSTTDAAHYMWLTVAPGHRHLGVPGTGARIRTDGSDGVDLVEVLDAYFRLNWLELDCARTGGWVGNAVLLGYRADYAELANLLAYDGVYKAIGIGDYVKGTIVRNSIITGFKGHPAAISVIGPHAGEVAYVYDNTVFDTRQDGLGVYTSGRGPFWIEAWNNIVMASGWSDFASASYGCSGHNLSSDDSAPGIGAHLDQSADAVMRSTTPGALDLHLASGSPAIDQGRDLSFAFDIDIDADARPLGAAWDIGADEGY